MAKKKQYYVRNKERGFVGNCCLWWQWDDNGYTCDIRAAKVFLDSELEGIRGNPKYAIYEIGMINNLVQHHIDFQDLRAKRKVPHTMLHKAEIVHGHQ